jgi:hypothetical protein
MGTSVFIRAFSKLVKRSAVMPDEEGGCGVLEEGVGVVVDDVEEEEEEEEALLVVEEATSRIFNAPDNRTALSTVTDFNRGATSNNSSSSVRWISLNTILCNMDSRC